MKSRDCSPEPSTRNGLSVMRAAHDAGERHVGPLAWPVHREVPERHDVEAERAGIDARKLLARQLCDPVRRDRQFRIVLARGIPLGVAVDRRRGCERDTNTRRTRRFEQPLRHANVVVDVHVEAESPARAHAGLRGEMEDAVDTVEQRRQLGLGEIGLDQREPAVLASGGRGSAPSARARSSP